MNGNLWTVAVLVVVLVVGALAISGSATEQAAFQQTVNETQTLSQNESVTLENGSDAVVFYENETVRDGTETFERGDDYLIDYETGQITANDSRLHNRTVDINYSTERVTDEQTSNLIGTIDLLDPVLGWLVILAMLATLVGYVARW